MDTVYIETTIVGHLIGRLLADPTVAARQSATREWWRLEALHYQCFVSLLVIDECSAGNAEAAEE